MNVTPPWWWVTSYRGEGPRLGCAGRFGGQSCKLFKIRTILENGAHGCLPTCTPGLGPLPDEAWCVVSGMTNLLVLTTCPFLPFFPPLYPSPGHPSLPVPVDPSRVTTQPVSIPQPLSKRRSGLRGCLSLSPPCPLWGGGESAPPTL